MNFNSLKNEALEMMREQGYTTVERGTNTRKALVVRKLAGLHAIQPGTKGIDILINAVDTAWTEYVIETDA